MTTCRPFKYLQTLSILCFLLGSITPAMAQYFLPDSSNQKRIDSLSLEIGKLSPEQQDSLLNYLLYLPLPNDWKNIDPFARQLIDLVLPKPYLVPVPDYARFTKGVDGYYFALQEMGYYGWAWPDSLHHKQNIDLALPIEKGLSPNLVKILGRSKNTLIILAVILQALLL